MTTYDKLMEINKRCEENIKSLNFSGKIEDLSKCITFFDDYNNWVTNCGFFSEYLLVQEALNECRNSICLCAQGFYKEAIITLRQCLEHTLFSTLLSSSDYKYRLWQAGKYDMSWNQIVDRQNGVFGVEFIRAYARDVDENRSMELIKIAKDVYRECSEFVHGNYEKINEFSNGIMYSEKAFGQYVKYFESIKYLICMALFIRFRDVLDDLDILRELESIIVDNIGMLPEIQLLYSKGDSVDE